MCHDHTARTNRAEPGAHAPEALACELCYMTSQQETGPQRPLTQERGSKSWARLGQGEKGRMADGSVHKEMGASSAGVAQWLSVDL